MNIKELSITNFRNYKKQTITLNPRINILVGDNAQGKTNILESIYTLSLARSYKAKDEDMILGGEEFYKIEGTIENKIKNSSFLVIGSKKGKRLFIDRVEIKKVSDYVGRLNVVLFSPDDLLLLKNGPSEKRKLIDLSLLQISKEYVEEYSAFKKELKLRNDYLKYLYPKVKDMEDIKDDMLEVLTTNFIDINKKIKEKRESFIIELEKNTNEKYKLLSGESAQIKLKYITNFENSINFYIDKYRSDIVSQTTQYGCHRDDIKFYKNGQDFETSASQGEMRMLTLSIKLALADMLYYKKGETPIVLLDDVFSELDKNHQNRLLKMLKENMQIIITTTDILKLGKLSLNNSKIFMINHAQIKEANINV